MPTPAEGRTELFRQPDGQISAWGQAPCKDAEEDGDTEGMSGVKSAESLPAGRVAIHSTGETIDVILHGLQFVHRAFPFLNDK